MTQADYARHDRITLTGITAKGYHGVLDFEKRDGQPFRRGRDPVQRFLCRRCDG